MSKLTLRKIQRALKSNAKRVASSGKFIPYTVSLQRWCEAYGVPKHFSWIRNLILTELDENEELRDYVRLDADLYDLHLDHDGVFIFSHILQDFFGLEQVRAMWRYLSAKNEEDKLFFKIKKCLEQVSQEELQMYEKTWTSYAAGHENIDTVQKVLNIIHDEQKNRARFRLVRRYKKMPIGGNR